MSDVTAKWSIPFMEGSDIGNTINETDQATAELLDDLVTPYDSGTLGFRPTSTPVDPSGLAGRRYYATDLGLEFVDTGTGWAPAGVAIGSGFDWYGTGDPSAELMICDGRAISRTTYSVLFGLLGTTFGVGNGSTTFNIPDTRDRALVGVSGTIARGATGGAKTHTLTDAEIPGTLVEGLSRAAVRNDVANVNVLIDVSPSSGPLGNPRIDGGGGAHNNMQPYVGAYKVIRVI